MRPPTGTSLTEPNRAALTLTLDELIAQRVAAGNPQSTTHGNSPWAGRFVGARHGQGMDFDDLRHYEPGDDVRHIDWKVSARRGTTHTRLYREEKEHAVTMVLDLRDTMLTGSIRLRAVHAACVLARRLWASVDSGSRVSVGVMDRHGIDFTERASGDRGALAGCNLIANRLDNLVNKRDRREPAETVDSLQLVPSIDALIVSLLGEGRRHGALELVGGLDDIHVATSRSLQLSLRQLRLIAPTHVVLVQDPIERHPLPPGSYTFRAPPDADRASLKVAAVRRVQLSRQARQQLRATLIEQQNRRLEVCRQAGVTVEFAQGPDP